MLEHGECVAVHCIVAIRPGKLDLLVHTSYSLNLWAREGGHYSLLLPPNTTYMLNKSVVLWPLKVGVSMFGR